jgi:hypothetical protein
VVQAPSCPYKYPLTRKIGGRKEETEKKRMKRAKQKKYEKTKRKKKRKERREPFSSAQRKRKTSRQPDNPSLSLSQLILGLDHQPRPLQKRVLFGFWQAQPRVCLVDTPSCLSFSFKIALS